MSGRFLLASASLQLPETADELPEDPNALATSFSRAETCPACRAEIAFDNLRRATCANGHKWGEFACQVHLLPVKTADSAFYADRCAVTLAVIDGIKTRTCMGCQRKALLELPVKQAEPHPLPQAPAPVDAATADGETPMEVEQTEDTQTQGKEDGGVVVNAMMKAATCCLHCGGRWMRVLL